MLKHVHPTPLSPFQFYQAIELLSLQHSSNSYISSPGPTALYESVVLLRTYIHFHYWFIEAAVRSAVFRAAVAVAVVANQSDIRKSTSVWPLKSPLNSGVHTMAGILAPNLGSRWNRADAVIPLVRGYALPLVGFSQPLELRRSASCDRGTHVHDHYKSPLPGTNVVIKVATSLEAVLSFPTCAMSVQCPPSIGYRLEIMQRFKITASPLLVKPTLWPWKRGYECGAPPPERRVCVIIVFTRRSAVKKKSQWRKQNYLNSFHE